MEVSVCGGVTWSVNSNGGCEIQSIFCDLTFQLYENFETILIDHTVEWDLLLQDLRNGDKFLVISVLNLFKRSTLKIMEIFF